MGNSNISEVRKRVSERWSKVDVKLDQAKVKRQRTCDETNAEISSQKIDIIDLTNSSDEETDTDVLEVIESTNVRDSSDCLGSRNTRSSKIEYPFRLIKSDIYDSGKNGYPSIDSPYFITLKDIFGDKSLRRSILFSFQYELEFLLNQFNKETVESIIVVAQEGTLIPPTSSDLCLMLNIVTILEISMPPFTCHHTKMILNFYEDKSCKIFIPSNNFTYMETNLPQQVCWLSPVLPHIAKPSEERSSFKENLLRYLCSYPTKDIRDRLVAPLTNIDFSRLSNVDFTYSTPNDINSGFKLLEEILSPSTDELNQGKLPQQYLCQTSSIGGPGAKGGNLFTHIWAPTFSNLIKTSNIKNTSQKPPPVLSTIHALSAFGDRIKTHIVFPTVEEIKNSPSGWLCSGWFHFHHAKNQQYYNMLLNDFSTFSKQDPLRISRERKATPSHSKFYMRSTLQETDDLDDPFARPDWCVYTSANLSLTAWGTQTRKPRNYEGGIVYKMTDSQMLKCASFVDIIYRKGQRLGDETKKATASLLENKRIININVPFTLPVKNYDTDQDECFCASTSYQQRDSMGDYNTPM